MPEIDKIFTICFTDYMGDDLRRFIDNMEKLYTRESKEVRSRVSDTEVVRFKRLYRSHPHD